MMPIFPVCLHAAALVFLVGCTGGKGDQAKVSLPAETVAAAAPLSNSPESSKQTEEVIPQTKGEVRLATRVSGSVVSHTQGSASFKVGGHVEKTFVRVGDIVKKGQVLAELDSTDFILRERLANLAVQQAKVQFEQAQRDLAREEQLRKENATSPAIIEKLTTAFTATKIGVETAQVNLETAKKAVTDTKLLAPFSGVVTRKHKSEGEFVGMGGPMFDLADTSDLEISLKVPEGLIRQVKVGRTLTVSNPSADLEIPVRVTRIVPVISESTRTFEIIGTPTRSGAALSPGQYVEADLN